MKMHICSCGSSLLVMSVRASVVINGSGDQVDVVADGVGYGPEPKTVACITCGRRWPNPRLNYAPELAEERSSMENIEIPPCREEEPIGLPIPGGWK